MIAIFVLLTLIMQMKHNLDADHVANLRLPQKDPLHVLVLEIIVHTAQQIHLAAACQDSSFLILKELVKEQFPQIMIVFQS